MTTCSTRGAWLTDSVANILMQHPPPNHTSSVIIHNARRRAVESNPDASFAVREEHTTFIFVGGTPAGTDGTGPEMRAAAAWADRMREGFNSKGLAIDWSYGHFEDPARIDIVKSYGAEGARRLRKVKGQYDPWNVFYKGYPRMRPAWKSPENRRSMRGDGLKKRWILPGPANWLITCSWLRKVRVIRGRSSLIARHNFIDSSPYIHTSVYKLV